MRKKIFHVLMHPYDVDSRVKNETESLIKNFDITVLCLNSFKRNDSLRNGVNISRHGIKSTSRFVSYLTGYGGMLSKMLFSKIDGIHAHDFNALPLAFIISKIKRVPLIYDSHELWSESHHEKNNQMLIGFAKKVELYLAKDANAIVTVSESIARHLEILFINKNVTVIKNTPSYTHDGHFDIFREKYKIGTSTPIFIYQGLISEERGVRLIFDALEGMSKNTPYVFIFLGAGPYLVVLKELIVFHELTNRIFLEDFVAQEDLLKYTSSADVGIHALDRSCLNHEYCLPNKVFEYVQAGIGMICPDLVELKSFVNKFKLGSLYESGNVIELRAAIERYINHPEEIERAKESALKSKTVLHWSVEEEKLMKLYLGTFNP
jgi:glycosyltransferase involved in cell wall biosynthesis